MSGLGFALAGTLGGEPDASLNNISKLLVVFGGAVQALEDAGQQVLTQRSIDNAVGVQLDVIGRIVGEARNGLDDETFRRFCRATISANRSNGTVANLIRVLSLVIFSDAAHYEVSQQANATVAFRVRDVAISPTLAGVAFRFLARTASTGVRVMLEYGVSPPATWFRFNTGPGFNRGHLIARIDHT